nr:transposase [Streptomyces sp. TLI_55]
MSGETGGRKACTTNRYGWEGGGPGVLLGRLPSGVRTFQSDSFGDRGPRCLPRPLLRSVAGRDGASCLPVPARGVRRGPRADRELDRASGARGFTVLPRRWAVERTLGWLMHHRRLIRDYETLPAHSTAMICLAMIALLARRLTRESTPTWRGISDHRA